MIGAVNSTGPQATAEKRELRRRDLSLGGEVAHHVDQREVALEV